MSWSQGYILAVINVIVPQSISNFKADLFISQQICGIPYILKPL